MSWTIRGAAMVFGDDVNTDLLHPSYFFSLNPDTVRQGFLRAVPGREGSHSQADQPRILVAGRNFGCGSSRETTMKSLQMAGVQAMVAVGFARIFQRNALCLGIPVFHSAQAGLLAVEGTTVTIDVDGLVGSIEGGPSIALEALDPYWKQVLEHGGLEGWLQGRFSL